MAWVMAGSVVRWSVPDAPEGRIRGNGSPAHRGGTALRLHDRVYGKCCGRNNGNGAEPVSSPRVGTQAAGAASRYHAGVNPIAGEPILAKRTVADLIADMLADAGVQRIYGIVGDSLNGLTDSLRRKKTIDWIRVRHEEVAAFAAGAEAHLTGDLAVCAGSCGPGNLHLINGLFDCHRNRVPVLAIAAHIPSSEIGRGYFQETHPVSLFRECSHYCELVSHP